MENNTPKVMLAIIAAIGLSKDDPEKHGIYSVDRKLPWPRLEKDFAFFKEKTIDHVVIMGRGTWESLPEKVRPLPGRLNIVVTSSLPLGKNFFNNDPSKPFFVCRSTKEAIDLAREERPDAHIFFIGGKQLWEEVIPLCTNIFITHVSGNFNESSREIKTFPELLEPEKHFKEKDFRLMLARTVTDGDYKLSFVGHHSGPPIYFPSDFKPIK